jgi:hypothetical protein
MPTIRAILLTLLAVASFAYAMSLARQESARQQSTFAGFPIVEKHVIVRHPSGELHRYIIEVNQ